MGTLVLHVLQYQPCQDSLHTVQICAVWNICTHMSTGKPASPVSISFAFAHCLSLSASRSVSGLGISLSRLGGTVYSGCVFFDQLYVDNNCAQVESIEEGVSVKAVAHDFVFLCTTVRGLAELCFSFFPVDSSVLCVCLAMASEPIAGAFLCFDQLYVDSNCAQADSIEVGASVKTISHDFVFRTTVRGLARLHCWLFLVDTSVLCLCSVIAAGSLERALVCLKYLPCCEDLS